MQRVALAIAGLIALAAAGFWWLTRPDPLSGDAIARLMAVEADPARGERIFWASGCASCHIAPDAPDADSPVLAGGQRFETEFGTFLAPNISPHPVQGIGGWTRADFANAMMRGISPEGAHYYPAFPYTAYARADLRDVADLHAFMETLPTSEMPNAPHELTFPFALRRGVGLWKWLYLRDDWVLVGDLTEQEAQGRYLVEALAHCGECHTARGPLGGLDLGSWLAGAPNPAGRGRIPDITPDTLGWSALDIALYLESGFTPSFDVAGGSMGAVVRAMARLENSDREAIAAYLLRIE